MNKDKIPEAISGLEKPFAVMSVGVPGSGKSTVLSELSEKTGIARVSPDQIRKELTGSETDQTKNKEVWDETYRIVGEHLKNGESVIIDATYTEHKRRIEAIELLKNLGAKAVVASLFNVDLDTAKKRNQSRERLVPVYAIERLYSQLEKNPVSADDGFDLIINVDDQDL